MDYSSGMQLLLGMILILSSIGVIAARQPVHACLSFLLLLLTLATFYIHLSAEFIGIMQILVYAGAILVIFMFVIILFQDAHQQIEKYKSKSSIPFLFVAGGAFLVTLFFFGRGLIGYRPKGHSLTESFGTVQSLGQALYVDFFFPFEAVILIFLVALVGALYIGRKVSK